jgi:hypothetical protein
MAPRIIFACRREIIVAVAALGFLVFCSPVLAGSSDSEENSGSRVKKELSETLQAIKGFAAEQREEAVKQAKIALEEMDAAMERLEERIDQNWEKMDQAAREKAKETLKSLKEKRTKLAEWYGGLKHSSAKAWDHVKGGLLESYQALKSSFQEAEKEFE